MKLHEKIFYYRKRSGLSQEALAEILGVSRQAVSKWETGDSQPELANLLAMARTFGVTTDHLLSDEEAPSEEKREEGTRKDDGSHRKKTASRVFNTLSCLAKRYGWLGGVYVALSGVPVFIVGLVMNVIARSSEKMLGAFGGSVDVTVDRFGNAVTHSVFTDPVSAISYAVLGIGAAIIIGGIILAAYLKKKLK